MTKVVLLFVFFLRSGIICAQDHASENPSSNQNKPVFVERTAEFVGGLATLRKFLAKNIKYPKSARKARIEGKVLVKFVVEADGAVSNIVVLKGVSQELDAEAARVVSIMPKWKPGDRGGVPIRQDYVLPINFKL